MRRRSKKVTGEVKPIMIKTEIYEEALFETVKRGAPEISEDEYVR